MPVTVRPAVVEDIPSLMGLLTQVNRVHHDGRPDLFELGTKYSPEELAGLLADEQTPVLVAVDGQGTVLGHGFCRWMPVPDGGILAPVRTLYIDDICVDEQARGRQVGTALYEGALQLARDGGAYNVTLNVWACNPGARAFYEAMGMVPQRTTMEQVL